MQSPDLLSVYANSIAAKYFIYTIKPASMGQNTDCDPGVVVSIGLVCSYLQFIKHLLVSEIILYDYIGTKK